MNHSFFLCLATRSMRFWYACLLGSVPGTWVAGPHFLGPCRSLNGSAANCSEPHCRPITSLYSRRRLKGYAILPKVILGVKFNDRIEVVRSQIRPVAA